jgi:hypothetical protein
VKHSFPGVASLIIVLSVVTSLLAKGPTVKITVSGGGLFTPIQITDATIVRPFQVWAGPGTTTCIQRVCSEHMDGFIIDWASGVVAERPSGLQRYEVAFFASDEQRTADGRGVETLPPRVVYIVVYEHDPSTGHGYVYLPTDKDDQRYGANTASIYRGGLERHWFRATSEWETVVGPLIAHSATR